MPAGTEGAAAERIRRPTPPPPDREDIFAERASAARHGLGASLPTRDRRRDRDQVARLRGTSLAEGTAVDILVAPPEASEARRVAFSREAELVARLDHPGCPRFYELGSRTDGSLFVVSAPVARRRCAACSRRRWG